MKWFLITLAIGLASSDKLDHTYLPPPGAQFAGGILGNQDAPLEPPHNTHPGSGQIIPGHEQHHPSLGVNGEPVNFGDKIPKVPFNYKQENLPTTTTSYAFSQTTTYPPTEGFNPANLPINPVTGLPILLDQGNIPFGSTQGQQNTQQLPGINQGQNPVYGTNLQPGVIPQGPNTINYNQPGFNQPINQISGQYPGQNLVNSGAQIPESVNQFRSQNQGQLRIGQGFVRQGLLPTGTTNQPFNQYPVQNLGNNGGVVSIPGGNQGLVQYPSQDATNQGLVPSTVSPINSQSGVNQYGVNYDGSQGPLTQGTYTGQPINVGEPQPTQTSYQNQGPFNTGGISQYSTKHPNVSGLRGQGSSPSYNGITSTTPFPAIPSSTPEYSSVRPVYRPERPQAEADRNAMILNYENVRTPNGYYYSFDTSNGIHADESGIVDNGTKAQGSYSYIGDDGKLYSVYYTADENGFQPRGDHLPTPPPIPEAIQRVIEQAAKDEAAGIVDDGSYDEFKYGDDKYQGISNHRRPQNQGPKTFGVVKPITGIKDVEYDEGISQNQFDDTVPVSGVKKGSDNNLPVKRPSNEGINKNGVVDQEIRRISENSGKPIQDFHEHGKPVEKQGPFNRGNSQNKQGTASGSPVSNGNNIVFNDAEDEIDNKDSTVNNQGFSSRRPISDGGKDALVTKYPGANVDVTTSNYPKTESDGFVDNDSQTIVSSKPGAFDEYDDNKDLGYDSITGAPIVGGKKQTLTKRIKGTRRPGSNKQNENLNVLGQNDVQENAKTPSISEYIENAAKQPTSQQQITQQSSGYHYQQPSTTFEQNTFPSRFRPQEIPTTIKPDQRNTEYIEGTTRKPFMTPNVYEQNEKASPSTTRKPFTTKGVTSPSENAYTDYKDDDYATDLDIDDERNSSDKIPVEKSGITRPYETTRKGSRPRYGQNDRKSEISQTQPSRPGHKTGNTEALAPGYTYGPTTSTPTHHSRFGTTESPQNTRLDGRRPSNPNFEATTAVGTPVTQSSLGQTAPNYKYQSTGPHSKYFDSNVVSGYPTSRYTPGLGSTSGTPAVSTPQNYYTSTFRPSQSYSTTSSSPTSGYQPGSGVQFPVGPTGSPVTTQDNVFHTGYHYGPPKSGNPSFGHDAGFFTPTDSSRVSPTSPIRTYQTTFQGPGEFPSTTLKPSIGGRQDNFIPSYQGSTTSPLQDHQGNFQNQPSTPAYSTTIMSSTPGSKTTYDYPGSPITYKDTTGYEYGPSRPNYSSTNSPSTIGTTPAPYNPTGATIPSQGSTTYRPVFQNTEDLYVGGSVDGFGRPIPTNQGSNTGFTYPTQSPIGSYNGPNFGGNQPSTSYPGEQPRVIGEDFSGPKQPQRYDPKTGYHYK